MTVREWEGEVVFLHEVAPGAADRSYGIQVARLAGLPETVLARARQVLAVLESALPAIRAHARRSAAFRAPLRRQKSRKLILSMTCSIRCAPTN